MADFTVRVNGRVLTDAELEAIDDGDREAAHLTDPSRYGGGASGGSPSQTPARHFKHKRHVLGKRIT